MAWIPSHVRPFASACQTSNISTLRAAMPFGPCGDQMRSCRPRFHAWGEAVERAERSVPVVWATFGRKKASTSALRDRPAAVRDDKFIDVHRARRSGEVGKLRPDGARWFLCDRKNARANVTRSGRDRHELNARAHCTRSRGPIKRVLLRPYADKPMIEQSRGFCRGSKTFVGRHDELSNGTWIHHDPGVRADGFTLSNNSFVGANRTAFVVANPIESVACARGLSCAPIAFGADFLGHFETHRASCLAACECYGAHRATSRNPICLDLKRYGRRRAWR
jgi:hypothetical protein